MLKNHPKGLLVAFFSNMGERFGFYTMMAILVLFLQAKYDLNAESAGSIYSWFYFGIYALALIGGIVADKTGNYKGTITIGIVTMLLGYIIMAIPGMPLSFAVIGLFTIALGNGFFKGNLQALVGQMYDNEQYAHLRDRAYMVFYMGINVGAFFAPSAATSIRNWYLKTEGFAYDGSLPSLCHQFVKGQLADSSTLFSLAEKASIGTPVTDLKVFAMQYLKVFATGYNYAFGVAAGAMIISMVVFLVFKGMLPNKEKSTATGGEKIKTNPMHVLTALGAFIGSLLLIFLGTKSYDISLATSLFIGFVAWIWVISTKEERPRIKALLMVFLVVIFFWMSFHQNGLTMTLFARDFTATTVGMITNIFFDLKSLLSVVIGLFGLYLATKKVETIKNRITGITLSLAGGALAYYFVSQYPEVNNIQPETFQHFNPLFIVFLTPVIMGLFTWMNNKGIEPSTPKKIGIGMIIAAVGFMVMLFGSLGLQSPFELLGAPSPDRASPYVLINSYLVLTVAELFLSPMGLSFVSKVSPSRFQGLMQGGWLLATAVGNKFLFVGTFFWDKIALWQLWSIFILCCVASAIFIFSIMKRLERAAS